MPPGPEDSEEQAAFQLRMPLSRREQLDRMISKWKSKGALPNRASRNDWINELIAVCLDAPAAEQERIARLVAARHE